MSARVCEFCKGEATATQDGVTISCPRCNGTGTSQPQSEALPAPDAKGLRDDSYQWGNPPFPKYPAETVDSMAEIGEAFMDEMPKDYNWCQSPSEVIAHLQNERDDALAELEKRTKILGVFQACLDQADMTEDKLRARIAAFKEQERKP